MDDTTVLEKDGRWDAWGYTHEDFDRIVSRVAFHTGVPEDVVKRFDIVKKLILHSYYEYEFLDLVYERALTTFEMALLMRHEQEIKAHAGETRYVGSRTKTI